MAAPAPTDSTSTRRRVLLVDDDPDIRFIADIALARIGGLVVVSADSAEAALAHLQTMALPDAILLDVSMPFGDGPTFLSLLKNSIDYSHIPVVFLTAHTGQEAVEALLALGAAGVLAKPFDPLTLAKRVGEILAW